MIMFILMEFNVNLAPLLAGAGVVTFAIGFGSQSLVKDVMTGFFIIFEDQFAVGDVVKVGQFQGTVEMIGLRSTRIRSWTGDTYYPQWKHYGRNQLLDQQFISGGGCRHRRG